MSNKHLTNEEKTICMIRASKNPEKAVQIALDLLTQLVAGESMESIAASYGVSLEGINDRS